MNIYEMILDEESLLSGVNALSLVETPAIESDWVALSDQKKIMLAEVSDEKRILMGAALIPDKPIYRNQNGEEFYIYFSKETIGMVAQKFFKNSNHKNATLEHQQPVEGVTIFESWIVDDPNFDKSKQYGLDVPSGTWMVSMKVDNEDIWNNYVKNNKVFGFSIEGSFANKLVDTDLSKQKNLEDIQLDKAIETIKQLTKQYYGN